MSFKSGTIAIVGRPNVGKSTLLNAFLGQKIAAVSKKPQMTRHKILGIKNCPGAQLLFLDTPGVHQPHKSLNEYLMEAVKEVINDADVFLFVMDPSGLDSEANRSVYELIRFKKKSIILVINKSDLVAPERLNLLLEEGRRQFDVASVVAISALSKDVAALEKEIIGRLSEGPAYFPEDQVTDRSERFLVAEMIREKIMDLTHEEVPYSVTVQIESFKDPQETDIKKVIRIEAAIIVEKESQKPILVGKGGQMIKSIGEAARKDIETELGGQVYLKLFVKVVRDWTQDPQKVREFEGMK